MNKEMSYDVNKEMVYDAMIYEIGTLIKLVAGRNIRAISIVANNVRKHYDLCELEDVDNKLLYDCYCRIAGEDEYL